jgi:hypothetical protein
MGRGWMGNRQLEHLDAIDSWLEHHLLDDLDKNQITHIKIKYKNTRVKLKFFYECMGDIMD